MFSNIISFPNLGMSFKINRVAFTMGKEVYWYGIIIALGFALAVAFAMKRAKKYDISQDTLFDLVIWGLPVSIIFARLYYVLGDLGRPGGWTFGEVIAIWDGGIAIYGAILGATLMGITYCRVKKISMYKVFDFATPSLMIGQIIGRWGNFVNAEVYGTATSLPWGMSINGATPVHPLFLYESLWMLIGLIGILVYNKYKKREGSIFMLYILWYSVGRIWMEMLRRDDGDLSFVLKIGSVPLSLLTAIVLVVLALAGLWYIHARTEKASETQESAEKLKELS